MTHTLPGSDKKIHEITVKSALFTCPAHHTAGLPPPFLVSGTHAVPGSFLLSPFPRANGTFIRLYIPAVGLTVIILIFSHMQSARRAARLRLATASPLPSHFDPSQLTPPQPLRHCHPRTLHHLLIPTIRLLQQLLPGSLNKGARSHSFRSSEKRLEALTRWASNFWHVTATSILTTAATLQLMMRMNTTVYEQITFTCHPPHQFPVISSRGAPRHGRPQPTT